MLAISFSLCIFCPPIPPLLERGREEEEWGELRRDGGGRQGKGGCHIGATDDARAFVLKFSIGLFDLSDKIPANN